MMNPMACMQMMNPNVHMQVMTQAMDSNTYYRMVGEIVSPELYEKWHREMTAMTA